MTKRTIYTLEVSDPDNKIMKLLDYIKFVTDIGHSFEVVVDPPQKGGKKFYIDGDGWDRIFSINSVSKGVTK